MQIIPGDDPLYEKAVEVSSKITEVTDYLQQIGLEASPQKLELQVTYHVPCHGNWRSSLNDAPRELLSGIEGVEMVEMEKPGACCGAGGAFFVDFKELSQKIREPKLRDIKQTGAELVVTQCPSCRSYLSAGLEEGQRVLHPITLLSMAYGFE
jgi:Fe-S oxidoreductase